MAAELPCTLHQSCKTVKYYSLIKGIVYKDYTGYIIAGTPTAEQLELTHMQLLYEYSDLIRTEKSKDIFDLWKKIVYTHWKLIFIGFAVDHLRREYNLEIAEQLVEIGFDFVVDDETKADTLTAIENEAKALIIYLNQYNKEYQLLAPDTKSEFERDEMDYIEELAILGQHQGYSIRADDITAFEFIAIVNAYIKINKAKSDAYNTVQ